MHEYGIVHGLDQALKQRSRSCSRAPRCSRSSSSLLTAAPEVAQCAAACPRARCVRGRRSRVDEMPNLVGEFVDRALLALFPGKKHDETHCQDGRG